LPATRIQSSSAGEGRPRLQGPDELRELFESYVEALALTPELGGLAESMRYALGGGGKRIRPVVCLAVGEAAGAEAEALLPAAASVELVHTFSLVHDDLPALDDDDLRRGMPSTHARFGEATAVLAGDALLAEAFRLALSYPASAVARELALGTARMIGGQYLDITGGALDTRELHRLKTGALFGAAVGCALVAAGVPDREQPPWRRFADELGFLFQLGDDLLDGDGYVLEHGRDGATRLAEQTLRRAENALDDVAADTSVLRELAESLLARTS
jgi:geranylgeranyl diphosphate synthase, type II